MPLEPKSADLPRIRGALTFYQVASVITGVLLLALCAEMLMKYAFGLELELGGPQGFLAFVPSGSITAVNLSTGILMVHGWFYVVYLFSDFRLWSLMRWPFSRFIVIALGGVIPFLSFILEARIGREVRAYLASRPSTGSGSDGGRSGSDVGSSGSDVGSSGSDVGSSGSEVGSSGSDGASSATIEPVEAQQ